ncbi:MAG: Ig-like domain-containing protein, partial [Eubacterium sp.]|nr:Ig-like domain-containing protein [Eubacterium sp.]
TSNTEQLVWASSNEGVATVTSAGKVVAVAKGTTKITCSNFQGNIVATCNVKVITPATSVALDANTKTLGVGETFDLTSSFNPETAEEAVKWTSSNETVASVSSSDDSQTSNQHKATIKGLKAGSATITVTSVTTGKTARCTVKVVESSTSNGTGTNSGTSSSSSSASNTNSSSASNGTSSSSASSSSTASNSTVSLAKVKLKKAKAKKGKKVLLQWKKVSGASKYQVSCSMKANFAKAKKKTTKGLKLTVKKLKKKKKYYFRVRAVSTSNGSTVYGAWSNVKKVKVKK